MALKLQSPTARVLGAAMVASLLSTALHAAPPKYPGERSLSKVCGVKVPAPIEKATSEYLVPMTAMGGDTKPLCALWQEVNPANEASLDLWKAVAGAHLLHTVKDQRSVQPYRQALATLLWQRTPSQLNSVDKTMAAVFSDITEHAALGANENPKEFAMRLDGKSPKVADTVRAYYDKNPPGPD